MVLALQLAEGGRAARRARDRRLAAAPARSAPEVAAVGCPAEIVDLDDDTSVVQLEPVLDRVDEGEEPRRD